MAYATWRIWGAALGTIMALLCGRPANAAFTVTFAEVGPNVVATGRGSLNLAGLSFYAVDPAAYSFAAVNPTIPNFRLGGLPTTSEDVYGITSNVLTFGPGANQGSICCTTQVNTTIGSGDSFTFVANTDIEVPHGYVSGTALSTSNTWNDASLYSMGLAAGTYVETYAVTGGTDSVTVIVQSVPEPATTALFALPLALLGFLHARRA